MDKDETFLRRAVQLAREAQQIGNLPVGAVIVLDDAVVGEGKNTIWVPQYSPGRHAEIEALESVAPELWAAAAQMTLYTTLEPCLMCAGAILLHRVGRVVFGSSDDRGGASIVIGHMPPAFERLFQSVEWVGPALWQECDALNEKVAALLMSRKEHV